MKHDKANGPEVNRENDPFSEAIREAEIRRAVLAAVGPLDPPSASADLSELRTYFAAAKETIARVLAFDERAAAYTLRKAELLGQSPHHPPFSRAAAISLWGAVSTSLDEIEHILRLGESPCDISIMLAKAQAVDDFSHRIDSLYREKDADYLLMLKRIGSHSERKPITPTPRGPRRQRRAKQSHQTDSDAKLIACLALHHAYETGAVTCDPVKSSVLARNTGVSEPTVSRFMKRRLGGSEGYRRLCQMGPEAISNKIRGLNQEYFEGKRLEGDVPD